MKKNIGIIKERHRVFNRVKELFLTEIISGKAQIEIIDFIDRSFLEITVYDLNSNHEEFYVRITAIRKNVFYITNDFSVFDEDGLLKIMKFRYGCEIK